MSKSSSVNSVKNLFQRGGPLRSKGDLLCKNGCGFYGNPEWQWYCSKCWRERGESAPKRTRSKPPPKSPKREVGASGSSLSLSGTEKNLKQMFRKKESSLPKTTEPQQAAKVSDIPPPESRIHQNELSTFLNHRLERSAVVDVSRQLKIFIEKVKADEEIAEIDDISNFVQEFYQQLRRRLLTKDYFQVLNDDDRDKVLDLCEKYLMVVCFKPLFCPTSTTDEDKDLSLQNRIRKLNWISTKELGCVLNESSQDVRDALHESINYILEMDSKISPEEKLDSLVSCCKKVFDLLQMSNEAPASADEFLPCLIYVCLKANPPRMISNVNFITRFRNEEKLRMGEAGYFFANLCCALSFIENLSAESVNMDHDKFESYMSGLAVPPGSWQSSLLMCESLQAMNQNLKTLGEIRNRFDKVAYEADKLKEEMAEFRSEISKEVQAVLERTSYTIKGPKKPVNMDEDLTPPPELPSPLLPFSSSSSPSTLPTNPINASSNPVQNQEKQDEEATTTETTSAEGVTSSSEEMKADKCSKNVADDLIGKSFPEDFVSSVSPSGGSGGGGGYRGFSAQNFDIPSISCKIISKAKAEEKEE